MRWNGKTGWALFLIACGVLILLGKLGLFGSLAGFLFPIAFLALGYVGIKNGRKIVGGLFVVIGLFALLAKLSSLIAFVLAAGLIVYGVSQLKSGKTYS